MEQITGVQLRSLLKSSSEIEISLVQDVLPEPAADEVIVRVEATPINPSDLGLLLGAADLSTAKETGSADKTVVTAPVTPAAMRALAARVDQSMVVGNEGAGTVVRAGASPAAQALVGKTVAIAGGAMYAQYRCIRADECFVLPEGVTAEQGASAYINPLTALGMIETMRREGHKALVHTAAASNLGQMLNKACMKDGIGLVNIVRSPQQAELLKGIGAKYICDSTSTTFFDDLTKALITTGATLAFDAIGGGKLAGQILTCMEAALSKNSTGYSTYGSPLHKQVYVYGALDLRPMELRRSFGMAWGVGGWLLFPFLEKIGLQAKQKLRQRVGAEITTTFASKYTKVVSLPEALSLSNMTVYARNATGEKFLIAPHKA
ncbi:zinc-binding dehydrogenase [Bradyrhizobium genosp. P]|uniref:zinc-binding dehydrogenase n=1 Tax=Bradyrhizobium genosp. P TaxID=83641 RepID=UPI003CF25FEB